MLSLVCSSLSELVWITEARTSCKESKYSDNRISQVRIKNKKFANKNYVWNDGKTEIEI
jgi:hypothetical protein